MIEEEMVNETLGSFGASPDWAIIGVELHRPTWADHIDQGLRYMVIGSREMGRAALETTAVFIRQRHAEPGSIFLTDRRRPLTHETRLTATMRGYSTAFGRTYGEALQSLMAHWSPDDPGAGLAGERASRPALPPAEQP